MHGNSNIKLKFTDCKFTREETTRTSRFKRKGRIKTYFRQKRVLNYEV